MKEPLPVRLSGEPREQQRKTKTKRRQVIIRCTACDRLIYLSAAWGNVDIGHYHLECRPEKYWPTREFSNPVPDHEES